MIKPYPGNIRENYQTKYTTTVYLEQEELLRMLLAFLQPGLEYTDDL